VSIYTDVDGVDLADLTDAAAQIGRSVDARRTATISSLRVA